MKQLSESGVLSPVGSKQLGESGYFCLFCEAGDRIQDLMHAKQIVLPTPAKSYD